MVGTFYSTWSDYQRLSRALQEERFVIVEGLVTNFSPMPYEGHRDEIFEVAGHRYSYSDYSLRPGFNNSAAHGGPIREGKRVRIADVGGQIARLEIAEEPASDTAGVSR